MIDLKSIEDCIEVLVGLQEHSYDFTLDTNDASIMRSIGRQVFKGTALTDRQFNLMQKKLTNYKTQFTSYQLDIDKAINQSRMPLREIDRSKIISLEGGYIKIRFAFSKKLISRIQSCLLKIKSKSYKHEKSSNEYYFIFNEANTAIVLTAFADNDFIIDKDLLNFYDKILKLEGKDTEYLPGIINGQLVNANDKVLENCKKDTNNNLLKIADRQRRYGLINFDYTSTNPNLTSKIALRPEQSIHCPISEYSLNQCFDAINKLDRYPLLVIIDPSKEEKQIFQSYYIFEKYLQPHQQTVFFRQDGQTKLNEFIVEKELNSSIDINTKVVYIKANKFPKVLLTLDWKPVATFAFENTNTATFKKTTMLYIQEHCDLILEREDSVYRNHMNKHRWSTFN